MDKCEILARIEDIGVLPVLRASSLQTAEELAGAILEGGISAMEVTMTVPGAVKLIGRLVKDYPGMLIGAGTVMDAETARICMLEGAAFIVSPAFQPATVAMCRRYAIPVMPGALTPTEIITAWEAGADVIKVFPASAMGGASYLKSLKAPLPHIKLIPTGGVSLANAAEFFAAGAVAVGVGADLVDEKAIVEGRRNAVVETARRYAQIAREFRS